MSTIQPGLYLVATPMGNMAELCPRALQLLRTAHKVYCENTQSLLRLLTHAGITGAAVPPLRAVHEANEDAFSSVVSSEVAAGQAIVYVSEAGVPCISDPGFRLVRACRARGISTIYAVGVPSAFLNALVISGLPTDLFVFAGFPPPKTVGRQKFFALHTATEGTVIFYESCHRLLRSLQDLQAVVGDERYVCVAAELTKLHEYSQTGPLGSIRIRQEVPKGEWVIAVAKASYTL